MNSFAFYLPYALYINLKLQHLYSRQKCHQAIMGEGEGKSGIKSMILSKLNIEKAKAVAFVLAIGFVIHNIVYFQNTGKISDKVLIRK